MLSEMEVTGQAFEDMQEQNIRLIRQLRSDILSKSENIPKLIICSFFREKDDANFKLMSERIKSNQIQRLSRKEKEKLMQQVSTQV